MVSSLSSATLALLLAKASTSSMALRSSRGTTSSSTRKTPSSGLRRHLSHLRPPTERNFFSFFFLDRSRTAVGTCLSGIDYDITIFLDQNKLRLSICIHHNLQLHGLSSCELQLPCRRDLLLVTIFGHVDATKPLQGA